VTRWGVRFPRSRQPRQTRLGGGVTITHVDILLEGAAKQRATCAGHAEAFPVGNPLQFCLDYGVNPEDEVDGLSLCAAVFFCPSNFTVQRLRSRRCRIWFRLDDG
jgi:hypothetical protein